MTSTSWNLQADGGYTGSWFDDQPYTRHTLQIVDDLGWVLPDRWANVALAGSDEGGRWNYGATLGKVGGDPPVKGQKPDEMTVEQAQEYAREVGEKVTDRGIRLAATKGYIPDARKIGRDWLIPYDGFNAYLDNRPKRGRRPK